MYILYCEYMKITMWTADYEMNMEVIFAVMNTT